MHAAGGKARGMAPNATLLSYDWGNDTEEIAEAIEENNLLIFNHSYSWYANNLSEYEFGKYTRFAYDLDKIANDAPYYLHVKAASNDRNDRDPKRYNYLRNGGYDILYREGVAKNILTVAAVEKVDNYSSPSSVKMSSFSNWGPTDDGRIKPDISGNGVGVYSATDKGNNTYVFKSGTSMASPNVSGSLLLLQQYYKRLNGFYMHAATLKGLTLHTALEAGRNPGPDYEYGWGLLNAEKAAETIKHNGELSLIKEVELDNNEVYSFKVRKNSINEPLMVSISWNDEASSVNLFDNILDNRTPVLVNDLDVRVKDSENKEYLPWKLDPEKPSAGATKGDNIVDNIERVEIEKGAEGEVYTVTVSHKGQLARNRQAVSVVVTGGRMVSGDCNISQWSREKEYKKGDIVEYLGDKFEAQHWSSAEAPFKFDKWGPWKFAGNCSTLGENPPSITIQSPAIDKEFNINDKITFSVKVTDIDNDLESVVLRREHELELGDETIEPKKIEGDIFTFEYTPNKYGDYTNTVIAIDSKGRKKTEALTVFVKEKNNALSLEFLNLKDGDIVYSGNTANINLRVLGLFSKKEYGKNLDVKLFVGFEGKEKEYEIINSNNDQTLFDYEYTYPEENANKPFVFIARIMRQNETLLEKKVKLVFKSNKAPMLELLSYKDKAFVDSETVEIKIKATDLDGSISKVVYEYRAKEGGYKTVEMIKEGDVYTTLYTVPDFKGTFYNIITAYDNLGRQKSVYTDTRVVADVPIDRQDISLKDVKGDDFFQSGDNYIIESNGEDTFYLHLKIDAASRNLLLESYELYLDGEIINEGDFQFLSLYERSYYGYFIKISEFDFSILGKRKLKLRVKDELGRWGEEELNITVVDNRTKVNITNLQNDQTYQLNNGEFIDVNVQVTSRDSRAIRVECEVIEVSQLKLFLFVYKFTSLDDMSNFVFEPKTGFSKIFIMAKVFIDNVLSDVKSVSINTYKLIKPPYPNPSTGIINIPWEESLGGFVVRVFDLNDTQQFQKYFEAKKEQQVDLTNLKRGMYVLRVEGVDINHKKEYKIILK